MRRWLWDLAAMHMVGSREADAVIKVQSKQPSHVPISLAVGPSWAGWVYLCRQAPITAEISDEFLAFMSRIQDLQVFGCLVNILQPFT